MKITWTKNLRLRIGAVVAALLATAGIYGVIQAQPLPHSTVSSAPAQTVTPQPVATGQALPSQGAFGTPLQPSSGGVTQAPAPPRAPRISARTRAS